MCVVRRKHDTPCEVAGAVTSALNAVNKIAVCLGGASDPSNPGPVESWADLQPVELR